MENVEIIAYQGTFFQYQYKTSCTQRIENCDLLDLTAGKDQHYRNGLSKLYSSGEVLMKRSNMFESFFLKKLCLPNKSELN